MSQCAPCGLATPRASVAGQAASLPASTAAPSPPSASVGTNPPLFCKRPSRGSPTSGAPMHVLLVGQPPCTRLDRITACAPSSSISAPAPPAATLSCHRITFVSVGLLLPFDVPLSKIAPPLAALLPLNVTLTSTGLLAPS